MKNCLTQLHNEILKYKGWADILTNFILVEGDTYFLIYALNDAESFIITLTKRGRSSSEINL